MKIQDLAERVTHNEELSEIIQTIYNIGWKATEDVKELLEASCELTRLVAASMKKEEKSVFEQVCTLLAHPDVIEEYGDLALPFLEHRLSDSETVEDSNTSHENEEEDPFAEETADSESEDDYRYRGFRMIEEIRSAIRTVDTCSMLTLAVASASMVMSMANLFYTLKKSTDGNDNRFCFMPPMGMPSSTTLHYDPWYDF